MRIILLLLAAGLGVAASGAAAAAEIARGSMVRSTGPHGAFKPGFGHGFKGMRPHRPNPGRGHWRDRHDRHWSSDPGFAYPYAGGFIDVGYASVDRHGNGFFADGGGAVRVRGGRPHYDYDRSYPYEWAPVRGPSVGWSVDASELPEALDCGLEKGVRVCRGGR